MAGNAFSWKKLQGQAVVAPSLLACDFARAGEQIDQALAGGAQVLHVDIMDGHFVPNLSMGPGFVRSIRRYTDCPLDVHLMVSQPQTFAEHFAQAGASSITFHVEAAAEPMSLIRRLHDLGLGAGVTLRPSTSDKTLDAVIEHVDLVLVMTVEPGYGGQEFMMPMLDKIAAVRSRLRPEQRLEVDGGINPSTGAMCAQRGADTFVSGESIFGAPDVAAAVKQLFDAVKQPRRQ